VALLAVQLCATASAQSPPNTVVKVTGGEIQGQASPGGGAVFKGIPFAAPPVGDLRWREPQPVKSWSGVRQATDYSRACAQVGNNPNAAASSEDCLYLNVFTAEWPSKAKKPVMLWLYGGGNFGGSAMGGTGGGNEPPFDGAGLTPHGVILVTINYRVGAFSFIGHPELTAESPHHTSGNYGILDQIAALKWVHENITRFGGDPNNVTVFGQSAGAVDTSYLLVSPLTKGLIQRAILESGNPTVGGTPSYSKAELEHEGVMLGEVLNAPTLKALRAVPTATILANMSKFNKLLSGRAVDTLPTNVGVDGYVITEKAMATYRSGKESAVPMIVGTTAHEGGYPLFLSVLGDPFFKGTPEQVSAALKKVLESFYGKYPDLLSRTLTLYGVTPGSTPVKSDPLNGPVEVQLGTDLTMRCPAIQIARWHSAVAPAYHYEFSRGSEAHPPIHTAELQYVYGHLNSWESTPQDAQFATQVQEYWTNFAKTGDPNGPGLPKWPKYDGTSRESMDLSNDGPVVKAKLRGDECAAFADMIDRELGAQVAKH
jgi:para-nitrobenzyl esterase